jgi:hypothetical protein
VVGLSLIPAFGTLYHRLTLAESTRFLDTQKADEEAPDPKRTLTEKESSDKENAKYENTDVLVTSVPPQVQQIVKKKAPFKGTSYS